MLEIISAGLTILNVGKTIFDWSTGITVSKKLDRLDKKINHVLKLDDNVYYLDQNEVLSSTQNVIPSQESISVLRENGKKIWEETGENLIISQPILTPEKMKKYFKGNPDELLHNIRPLRESNMYSENDDPTLSPVIFNKWGQIFIGYIKVGYMKDYFDCEFESVLKNNSSKNQIIVKKTNISTHAAPNSSVKKESNFVQFSKLIASFEAEVFGIPRAKCNIYSEGLEIWIGKNQKPVFVAFNNAKIERINFFYSNQIKITSKSGNFTILKLNTVEDVYLLESFFLS
jgi:hypothetical protein